MTSKSSLVVRVARSQKDLEAIRELFVEFRNWLVEHREVTDFDDAILEAGLRRRDDEIRSFPGKYVPPDGALLLATQRGSVLGCVGMHKLEPKVCEVRRLYVRPAARGGGVGRALSLAALRRARWMGYERVVLDTLSTMKAAIALYRELGFQPIPAYWDSPFPGTLYFEYRLKPVPAH
jgi:putative acetyltransferase